jgi:hypothetical protein
LRDRIDLPDSEDVVFSFEPDEIDDVADALRLGYQVRAGGTRDEGSGTYRLLFIEPVNPPLEANEGGDDGDDISEDDSPTT